MKLAVIFAGGSGKRMHAKDRPKQFLFVHGKPIIVHTIEVFNSHPEIDGIIVVCIEGWIDYMQEMQYRYRLDKIGKIVPGGESGQMSIYQGLKAAAEVYGVEDNIVLIHDGVRPLIGDQLIDENSEAAKEEIIASGAEVYTPTEEELQAFQDAAQVVYDQMVEEGICTQEEMDEMLAIVEAAK